MVNKSIKKILSRVFTVISPPESVVDLGCGDGSWLTAARDLGVESAVGYDIRPVNGGVMYGDLTQNICVCSADLVICVEVAEHILESGADMLISNISNAGDMVLFSAATPGQWHETHINCQPPKYWYRKFAARGYSCFDCIRWSIWEDQDIAPWYRQNIMLYARGEARARIKLPERDYSYPIYAKHPDIYGR